MKTIHRLAAVVLAIAAAAPSIAADVAAPAVIITKLDDIKWVDNPAGTASQSIIYGDPAKPGPYALFIKWKAGNMSRPHYHQNDRWITVLSGTWWVGSGETYDPASTIPVTAGNFVKHTAKGIHYDGAKQADTIIMIHGDGPATSIPAEKK